MPEREKVMRGMHICATGSFDDCKMCPYDKLTTCQDVMLNDALALLKEQEARELSESCENCDEYDKEKHSCPKFCRVIRETVDEIKPKWIPVTERLPEEKGCEYLVVYDGRVTVKPFGRTDFFTRDTEWGLIPITKGVKYWMPLPEPPKEEDDA